MRRRRNEFVSFARLFGPTEARVGDSLHSSRGVGVTQLQMTMPRIPANWTRCARIANALDARKAGGRCARN